VADRGFGDDGGLTELFWASMLDPDANMRALTAIQAEGFRAASQLVDRFIRIATTNGSGTGRTTMSSDRPTERNSAADADGDATTERLLRSWWSLTEQFLQGSARVADVASDGPAKLDLTNGEAHGSLSLEAAAPGVARGEVWLHNTGAGDLGAIRLRCSDLLAHDGSLITSARIEFDPELAEMPRRSSRGIGVKILVGQDVQPARYSGTLLAEGYPDLAMPVALTVSPLIS
jgi:hypothetical protein